MRLFAICPRIRKDSGRVVASTAWRLRLLLLGMIYRQVVIDPTNQTITLSARYLWLFRFQRNIAFSEIQAVTYGYEDTSPNSFFSYAHDSYDWFTVGLRLKNNTEIGLFNFIGEGTFSNNSSIPNWVFWDDFVFDVAGSQENESRVFVDVISKLIGVTVVPPRVY